MDIELSKFEEIKIGWNIQFDVKLTEEEVTKCDLRSLNHIGDYVIKKNGNIISFSCAFDHGELLGNETIEERLKAIKLDIGSLVNTCIN